MGILSICSKNSLAVKKDVAVFKMAVKKICKIKGTAKKWLCLYRLMAKNFITVQVDLCCLIPASLGTDQHKIHLN